MNAILYNDYRMAVQSTILPFSEKLHFSKASCPYIQKLEEDHSQLAQGFQADLGTTEQVRDDAIQIKQYSYPLIGGFIGGANVGYFAFLALAFAAAPVAPWITGCLYVATAEAAAAGVVIGYKEAQKEADLRAIPTLRLSLQREITWINERYQGVQTEMGLVAQRIATLSTPILDVEELQSAKDTLDQLSAVSAYFNKLLNSDDKDLVDYLKTM